MSPSRIFRATAFFTAAWDAWDRPDSAAGLLARRGVDILLRQVYSGGAVHELVPFELAEGDSVRRLEA